MKKKYKVLLIIAIVLVSLIALFYGGSFVFYKYVIHANVIEHDSSPVFIHSKATDAKKAFVIYQPGRTGKVKDMAYNIAKGLNDSSFEVTIDYPGEKIKKDISEYSVIVFGTPVYESHPSPVLLDYIKSVGDFSGKKVIVFSSGYLKDSPELDKIKALIKNPGTYKAIKFVSSDNDNTDKAYKLGRNAAEGN